MPIELPAMPDDVEPDGDVDIDALERAADASRERLAAADAVIARARGRDPRLDRDAARKRVARDAAKEVFLKPCADPARRALYEQDDAEWLLYYFGRPSGVADPFWYSFTLQQRRMIEAIATAILYGGDKAIAASRGEGKTSIFERLVLKYHLQGVLQFSVLCAATGTLADNSLDAIKSAVEENTLLGADYPEVCTPVLALENTPNRAHYMLVTGKRFDNGESFARWPAKFTWCGQEIIFPNVPGSPAGKSIIAARGLDSAVRGLKRKGRRVDLVGIDDPDTEDTSRSETQADKLEDRIDRSLAGLGGQQRSVGRVMLTTLQSRVGASYRYTDSQQKPTWKGERFRFLVRPPDRADMWDEYVQLYISELQSFAAGDDTDAGELCRNSHTFYLDNRDVMDSGAMVANPNRFNPTTLADGTQLEASALQHYYNQVARNGQEAVSTELDNDPPEVVGPVESGISLSKIKLRLSGYDRYEVPEGCTVITQGMDLRKLGVHWVVKAWRPDATNFVIDYGFTPTHGTVYGSDEGVELAVKRAILDRMEQSRSAPYRVDQTLIDSGWLSEVVYNTCQELGSLDVHPAKGVGQSNGCVRGRYIHMQKRTPTCKPGDGWNLSLQLPARVWLVNCDTDRWKAFEHARWMTPMGEPGAASLFGSMTDEERKIIKQRLPRMSQEHHGFAAHITAEVQVEEVVRETLRTYWKLKASRAQNHYLDAAYMSDVAASMRGIRLLGDSFRPNNTGPRKSLAEMAAKK